MLTSKSSVKEKSSKSLEKLEPTGFRASRSSTSQKSSPKQSKVNQAILDSLTHHHYLEKIKQVLRDKYRLDVYQYRTPYFLRRISMISKRLNTNNLKQIYFHIEGSRQGFLDFLNTLTIHVTEFFRDKSLWEYLRDEFFLSLWNGEFQGRTKPSRTDPYRIWSAGCSSGQEPYSLAIMLIESHRKYLTQTARNLAWDNTKIGRLPFEIYATDINARIIKKAKQGIFSEKTLKNADPKIIRRYFDKTDEGFVLCDEVKSKVKFQQHDLFKGRFREDFDLVTCRNVIIYFTKDQQRILFQRFWDSLKDSGHLIIGKSELLPPESTKLFDLVKLVEHVYKKDFPDKKE